MIRIYAFYSHINSIPIIIIMEDAAIISILTIDINVGT